VQPTERPCPAGSRTQPEPGIPDSRLSRRRQPVNPGWAWRTSRPAPASRRVRRP